MCILCLALSDLNYNHVKAGNSHDADDAAISGPFTRHVWTFFFELMEILDPPPNIPLPPVVVLLFIFFSETHELGAVPSCKSNGTAIVGTSWSINGSPMIFQSDCLGNEFLLFPQLCGKRKASLINEAGRSMRCI